MIRTPIQSSHLAAIGHNPLTSEMEVEFKNGKVYRYRNVSRSQFVQISLHPSPTAAFHALVRSRPDAHPYVKVP